MEGSIPLFKQRMKEQLKGENDRTLPNFAEAAQRRAIANIPTGAFNEVIPLKLTLTLKLPLTFKIHPNRNPPSVKPSRTRTIRELDFELTKIVTLVQGIDVKIDSRFARAHNIN